MPEIKVKHVVSFSSEDKVYKAENLLKPETYRKWKCTTPGEQKASVVLQFEKATEIHSIDIGNEHSAFVEVLVGRSSDSSNDYQVLLVASSFMSPLESRNSTNTNRVRMFGPEKLAQNTKNEKWDCVQIVCTQPFNKNVQYGLSFVKFHSAPDPNEQAASEKKESELKLGGFKLKDEEDSSLPVGNLFFKRKEENLTSVTGPAAIRQASSYAAAVLESASSPPGVSKLVLPVKRRHDDSDGQKSLPIPAKKKETTIAHVNRGKVGYKNIEEEEESSSQKTTFLVPKGFDVGKTSLTSTNKTLASKAKPEGKKKKKKSFNQLMEKVVFVISGIQNPERSEIRDRALEMGARYKADWDSSCTHLICAFVNTPKYNVVRSKSGRIVTKNWIYDCYKKKELIPWRNYMLGKYSISTTEDEESDEDDDKEAKDVKKPKPTSTVSPVKKNQLNGSTKKDPLDRSATKNPMNGSPSKRRLNGPAESLSSPSTSKKRSAVSSTLNDDDDDTDAEMDYKAPTDVDESSGGDTEDELRKFEQRNKEKNSTLAISSNNRNGNTICTDSSTDEEEFEDKPDTSNLQLPPLPDILKDKNIFLHGEFLPKDRRFLERYITAYAGILHDSLNERVKYVITESKWNNDFEEALAQNPELIFVRPQWIYKCHIRRKCVPFHPYIIIPGR